MSTTTWHTCWLALLMTSLTTAPATGATTPVGSAEHTAPPPAAPHAGARVAGVPAASAARTGEHARATADSGMTLHGGQEGTVFRSLTVEGEDRIRYEFERPTLQIDLDPEKAPGLEWGNAGDVLKRTSPDFSAPLVGMSSREPSPYVAHPWLSSFASGSVARFRPQVEGSERWKLVIVNAKGEPVMTYQGRGEPPREIGWDGRSASGVGVVPGLTYSYVFEVYDRAGNKRNFVGEGFKVSAYRLDSADGPSLTFTAAALGDGFGAAPAPSAGSSAAVPPILIEAAMWLDEQPRATQPIRVAVTGRSAEAAGALADAVVRGIGPYVIGDPARIRPTADVQPDAPEGGIVRIGFAR